MLKIFLLVLAIFCFLHTIRDYLQIKGVKNWFTTVGHVWDAPQYEKHGMVVTTILGFLFIFWALSL